jgi:hypothetical protein
MIQRTELQILERRFLPLAEQLYLRGELNAHGDKETAL